MLLNIILGILCLSIVVLVHEYGHFLAAKSSGIVVETFSIGWGKPLLKIHRRGTDYALSPVPLGGYCKMKGESLFQKALENNQPTVDYEEGSLFSVKPWKRIITYLAGPLSNFIFAVAAMTVVWLVGFTVYSYDTRIILLSDYPAFATREQYPADSAGLETGDIVTAVNGREVVSFNDFQSIVAPKAVENIILTVQRGDQSLEIPVKPDLDKESGIGIIGVSAWIDPVIGGISEGSPAWAASLQKGDRILATNGITVNNHLDFYTALMEGTSTAEIRYLRDGTEETGTMVLVYDEEGFPDTGMAFAARAFPSPELGFFGALARGCTDAVSTFYTTLKSIGLFFKGLNPGKALSGPIRITVLAGEIATEGFSEGFRVGILNLLRLLSLFSVALCFMNLLPIPALDGGMIVYNIIEAVKGKSLKPRTFYRYQMIGVVFILALLFFTTFSDISFLSQR